MKPNREPVTWASVIAAILSLLSLGVAMGWYSLTGEQFAATEQALGATGVVLWPLLASLWARLQVTPLVEPRDEDGMELVRADGTTPHVQERAMLR